MDHLSKTYYTFLILLIAGKDLAYHTEVLQTLCSQDKRGPFHKIPWNHYGSLPPLDPGVHDRPCSAP